MLSFSGERRKNEEEIGKCSKSESGPMLVATVNGLDQVGNAYSSDSQKSVEQEHQRFKCFI